MPKIYRLETPLEGSVGEGVFMLGFAYSYDCERRKGTRECYSMPCPNDLRERGSAVHKHVEKSGGYDSWFFGFRSLTQLKRAFPSILGRRKGLEDNGVRVSVFEVPKEYVLYGNAQVLFHREEAKRVEVLYPSTFEKDANYA